MTNRRKGDVVLRHLKQIKAGVDKPGHIAARREAKIASIEKSLVCPTLDNLLSVAIDLEALGWIEGAAGIAGIWKGKTDGWKLLQDSFAYSSWNVRICTCLFQHGRLKTGWSFTHLNLAARCLAHAIATGGDTFAEWCGQTLLGNFTSGTGLYDNSPRAFEPFMVHLFARWKNLSVSNFAIPCVSLGVYKEVLDAWYNEPRFATAVVNACEYHSEHSIEEEIAHAEFVSVPHNVFPAEILAIKRVRDEESLPWPAFQHPLLNTHLGQLPPSLPHPKSDLLERVEASVRATLPEVGPVNE